MSQAFTVADNSFADVKKIQQLNMPSNMTPMTNLVSGENSVSATNSQQGDRISLRSVSARKTTLAPVTNPYLDNDFHPKLKTPASKKRKKLVPIYTPCTANLVNSNSLTLKANMISASESRNNVLRQNRILDNYLTSGFTMDPSKQVSKTTSEQRMTAQTAP